MRFSKNLRQKKTRGSAVVEFVLVGTPLVISALTVVAISISAFCLMVLRDSAVEGARYAALADQSAYSGCLRAETLAQAALRGLSRNSMTCESFTGESAAVKLEMRFPLVGLLTFPMALSAMGTAPYER